MRGDAWALRRPSRLVVAIGVAVAILAAATVHVPKARALVNDGNCTAQTTMSEWNSKGLKGRRELLVVELHRDVNAVLIDCISHTRNVIGSTKWGPANSGVNFCDSETDWYPAVWYTPYTGYGDIDQYTTGGDVWTSAYGGCHIVSSTHVQCETVANYTPGAPIPFGAAVTGGATAVHLP